MSGRKVAGLIALAIAVGVAIGPSGCSGAPEPLELTAAQSGSTQKVAVGQEIRISLEANPTTGYQWAVDGDVPAQLEQVGDPVFTAASSAMGAGGTEVWTYSVRSAGSGTLKMKYWRSFEPTAAPVKTFSVTVQAE